VGQLLSGVIRRANARGLEEYCLRTALSFWQMPTNDLAFFDYLGTTGPILARDHRTLPRSDPLTFWPLGAFRRRASGLLLLCRQCDAEEMQIDKVKSGGRSWHTINPHRSPVLTYGREKPSRGSLPRSSIGGFWDFVDLRTGEKRKKDPEFIRWGKAVIAWIKEGCTENCELHGFAYPATPEVVAAVSRGEIMLTS
jgi:hypothetical protein